MLPITITVNSLTYKGFLSPLQVFSIFPPHNSGMHPFANCLGRILAKRCRLKRPEPRKARREVLAVWLSRRIRATGPRFGGFGVRNPPTWPTRAFRCFIEMRPLTTPWTIDLFDAKRSVGEARPSSLPHRSSLYHVSRRHPMLNSNPLSPEASSICEPSAILPESRARPREVSTSFWIRRLSGRAP